MIAAATLLAGCSQQHKDDLQPVQSQPSAERFSMEPYLRANRLGRWTYMRTEQEHAHRAVTYTRLSDSNRMMEGRLLTRKFSPLDQYFLKPSSTQSDDADRPRAPLKGGTAFLFELLEPMEPFPEDLTPDNPIVSTTPVVYYEYDGRQLSRGTLTRTVEIEGFDELEVPAGRFAGCLRLRLDFTLEIPWVLDMEWNSFIWLSPEMGEVRRIEKMSGWFLVFPFSSSHEYQLISGQPYLSSPEPQSVRKPRWQYGAALLDRAIPRPQIAGLVVDYANHAVQEGPESAPAETPEPSVGAGSESGREGE